ncbi:MAG: 6-phosphogluconolactonase [Acidobacteriota bacterium]
MTTRILKSTRAGVRVYSGPEELALKAARSFARLADQYVLGCGRFTVALSGGSTPKAMFEALAAEPFRETVPWGSILFFWGDERTVPADHPDSNYHMAYTTLLSLVPVPDQNIFRMPADNPDLEAAAAAYSNTLLGVGDTREGFPAIDLVFLGMGADGHTASLFPGTEALRVTDRVVVPNYVPKLKTHRLTLAVPTINAARNVRFLVSGADKAEPLKSVLEGERDPERYPSQLIHPVDGSLLWMVDEAAAKLLA